MCVDYAHSLNPKPNPTQTRPTPQSTNDLLGLAGDELSVSHQHQPGVKRSRSFLTLPGPREPKVVAVKKRKRRAAGGRNRGGGLDSDEDDDFSSVG